MSRGESDRARKVLEQDLDLVRSVSGPETAFREFVLSEALTLAALGRSYSRDGKQDEAWAPIQEAIGHGEAYLAVNPGDGDLSHGLFELVACMLRDLARSENDRLYEQCNARAVALLERLKSRPDVHVGDMFELSGYHRIRADYLMSRGQSDRARQVLEQDLELVRSVSGPETAFREFVLSEALTLAALGRWPCEFTPLRSPIQPQPANVATQELERVLAELPARRLGLLPSIVTSPWLTPEDLSGEAWVDRVISSIKTDAALFHLDPTRIPAIGWQMRNAWAHTLWQRRVGKLGDAHRVADQLLALAERLTRSYPDQAAAYMLLSEGYVQKAKNAWREDEAAVIKQWLRKSVDAAVHAATLEPDNDEARALVISRRARLNKLASR